MNKTTEALKLAEEANIQSWYGVGGAWPEKQEMISAAYRLSSWLSAALDDPKVCQEYKDAINAWFDAAMPVAPNHREINESIHNRQIVIRKCVSLLRDEMNTVPQLGASWLRLQRLIGLIEDIGDGQVEQEKQEPVAAVEVTYGREPECYVIGDIDNLPEGVFKLYAAPVQREWVELTLQELQACCGGELSHGVSVHAAIAAFKEKNK